MSSINDDYEEYRYLCELIGAPIMHIYHGVAFYNHEKELLRILGFKNKEDYYSALRKGENRDNNINSILND